MHCTCVSRPEHTCSKLASATHRSLGVRFASGEDDYGSQDGIFGAAGFDVTEAFDCEGVSILQAGTRGVVFDPRFRLSPVRYSVGRRPELLKPPRGQTPLGSRPPVNPGKRRPKTTLRDPTKISVQDVSGDPTCDCFIPI